jgi:formate-nitrite transporter family protein
MPNETSNSSEAAQPGGDRPEESGWSAPSNSEAAETETSNSSHQKNLERPTAADIYEQVSKNARSELKRPSLSLAISGFTGGTFMGLSALSVGLVAAVLGNSPVAFILSRMFYPLGFIVVIIGRSQLFTENTLYPVALVLAEKKELWNTLRLWSIVLPANVFGAFAFACLASLTHAVPKEAVQAIAQMGVTAAQMPPSSIFWSGVVGGWIIATAAWLVSGSHSITGSVLIIWLLTFVVGLGNFAHCIATSGEILISVLTGRLAWSTYPHWFGLAVAGNICGGVLMVTLLEYGQVIYGGPADADTEAAI